MCEYRGGKPPCVMKVKVRSAHRGGIRKEHHRPIWIFLKDLSKSIFVVTREMVIYGRAG